MKKKIILLYSFLVLLFLLTGCIKDTDFDQAENIVLTPINELNLIYFNVGAESFYDESTATEILTVRDTTEIRFLDDEVIQDGLRRVDFYFKFTNSIPRDFWVDFQFLSEFNDTTYVTQTPVDSGTLQNPVMTEFIEIVEGDGIVNLTMSDRLVISITIPSADENLDGSLNLQSKTTYYLEL
jgi:hypothetical protein